MAAEPAPDGRKAADPWPVRWLLAPAPAARLASLRIAVGAYAALWALVRLPAHLDHADQVASRWQPVGVLAPLDAPLPGAVVVALSLITPPLAAVFAAGWAYRLVAPACAAAVLVLATLDSSWGQVFHTENLMVLHLVVLALAPAAADALVLRRPQRARSGPKLRRRIESTHRAASRPAEHGRGPAAPPSDPRDDARYGWPVRLAALVVVLSYLITGIAKLRIAGLGWVDGETLRHLVAYDNVRKGVLGDTYSPLGTALVAHAWVFGPLAVLALAVELGSWVALAGGRWRTAWVAAAWTFHVGVLASMAIVFAYPLSGVAFAPFFRLEVLVDRLARRRRPERTGAALAGRVRRP